MNTLKPIKDATTSFSRSVLGTLLFAFGLFLCSSFSAQAHIDNDVSRQFEALLEAAPSADVFKTQHSELEGNDIGPQLQRFDAVDEDSALVEASSGWRQLDAALARSERNLFASISETLNGNISQTTARTPKSVTDKPLPHSSGYAAALVSAPVCRRFRHPSGAAHRHAPLLPSRRTRARLLPHASSIRLLELPLFRPSLSA
ncbi:MAG: hypothetical protein ACLR7Z_05320 [Bilophila wadsworthia]